MPSESRRTMDEDEFRLHDDTIRNLEQLAHAPGELRFRTQLVQAIKDIRKEMHLMRVSIEKLENRKLLGELEIAKVAKREIKADAIIVKTVADVKRLWAGAMWFIVLVVGGVAAEGLRLMFTK